MLPSFAGKIAQWATQGFSFRCQRPTLYHLPGDRLPKRFWQEFRHWLQSTRVPGDLQLGTSRPSQREIPRRIFWCDRLARKNSCLQSFLQDFIEWVSWTPAFRQDSELAEGSYSRNTRLTFIWKRSAEQRTSSSSNPWRMSTLHWQVKLTEPGMKHIKIKALAF